MFNKYLIKLGWLSFLLININNFQQNKMIFRWYDMLWFNLTLYKEQCKVNGSYRQYLLLFNLGCYLVRLYYLGAWRCIWVNDQIPVDATGSPLLPFSPLMPKPVMQKPGVKQPTTATMKTVQLWPLLICKVKLFNINFVFIARASLKIDYWK